MKEPKCKYCKDLGFYLGKPCPYCVGKIEIEENPDVKKLMEMLGMKEKK